MKQKQKILWDHLRRICSPSQPYGCYSIPYKKNVKEFCLTIEKECGMEIPISKNDLYFEPVEGEPVFQTNAPNGINNLKLLRRNFNVPLQSQSKPIQQSQDVKKAWGDIEEKKLTPEIIQELKAIQLRGSANPKQFFRRPDNKSLPTKFHFAYPVRMSTIKAIGETTNLFCNSEKKKRRTLISDLLRNDKVTQFTKKKALSAQEAGRAGNKRSYKKRVFNNSQRKHS